MVGPLQGKVVAVTGAGRGIGAATAAAAARSGAKVAIGDVDTASAEATAASLGGSEQGVIALPLDVTDQTGFVAFLDEVENRLGPLDVLVNNAGIMPLARLLDEDDEVTGRMLEINVRAMIRGTREAVRRMQPRGSGHVVNIASTAGKAGLPGASTYGATKAAMVTFCEAVRLELRGTGIDVTAVLPGIVRTELAVGVPDLRGMSAVTPEAVADGIVEALVRPRAEVYVPAHAGPLINSARLMPRRMGEWISRRIGADRVFLDALERPERAAYERRATHS
ncbi:SDR family NAD(P)-dependent oxidoreductase [Nocardioides sp. JQ2195]|uniref:SDR family NAD(P)-dependent oxidoreductase n=1 Tax=Nocardioides sp. JQ2195 TaxID=2592334 RepID=UPI00143E2557|nr:SDR family NAD(P)-dependent oxidoreductase [Nocardioides sp. JQ2195]QIX25831.1 SDR family NAD(P)-dependent oxidoreductase [Nocardioides sp. JQ2195]